MYRRKTKTLASAAGALVFFVAVSSFVAERRGGGANYFQENFPFQGACISAMSEAIKFNLKAADGTPSAQEIQHTIHAIP